MQHMLKTAGKHVLAILLFLLLLISYFSPAIIDGKAIRQPDSEKASGMGHSQMEQYKETAEPGEFSVWSDAMFGGMPYVAGYGDPAPKLPGFKWLETPLKALSYADASMILVCLVCFYILMCVMGVNWWLAIAGSIAFAFASYNFILIVAGHIVKAYVIGYMPLTLAGMLLLFKRNYLWGTVVFLLGVAFSLSNGHIQITYYLAILCFIIWIGYLFTQWKDKNLKEAAKVTAIMAACVILAVLPNAKRMYADWDLGQHSTRGPTELTTVSEAGEKISSGLEKDYAFQWSYGKSELITLLIPGAYGGSSVESLGPDSEVYKAYQRQGGQPGGEMQAPTFWGDKPSTSGPVYFGAIICFLFVFGMFMIKNPMKWWLFGGAVFFTILALGKNMDWFNDIMFHYLPMYNKFRTVEMALVIPGLIFPIIAIWGLNILFTEKVDKKVSKKAIYWSLGITGGLSLIIWLAPSMLLSFRSNYDALYQLPEWFISALIVDRASMASSDGLRSLIFILLGAAVLFYYIRAENKTTLTVYAGAALAALILVDLWGVDKRYLNDSKFMNERPHEFYKPSSADNEIFQDKSNFRVLNLNNPFQETTTSYYHHSLGGYHAAKLRRYQELIDHRLIREMNSIIKVLQGATTLEEVYPALQTTPSLNMLNTKYIIYNPQQPPIYNPYALGNAWFVDKLEFVENADAEIQALNQIDPSKIAVIDKRFESDLAGFTPVTDSTATINLIMYRPNRLTYKSKTASEQLAIFSEIYYQPGWHATIDGKPVAHFRADWTLRAMRIPAGEHEIIFEFYPDTFVKTAYIESYSSLLILLLVIGAIGWSVFRKIRPKSSQVITS